MRDFYRKKQIRGILFLAIFLLSFRLGYSQNGHEIMEMRVDPVYFSPNGDGIQDQTFFSPVLKTEADIFRWRLVVKKEKGGKVWRTTGAGFSALIKWNGKNKKDRMVPDGNYAGILTIYGDGLKKSSRPTKVIVDTKLPVAELTVSTNVLDQSIPGQESITFEPKISDASPLEQWQIQIMDLTGQTVFAYSSTEAPHAVAWGGPQHLL